MTEANIPTRYGRLLQEHSVFDVAEIIEHEVDVRQKMDMDEYGKILFSAQHQIGRLLTLLEQEGVEHDLCPKNVATVEPVIVTKYEAYNTFCYNVQTRNAFTQHLKSYKSQISCANKELNDLQVVAKNTQRLYNELQNLLADHQFNKKA